MADKNLLLCELILGSIYFWDKEKACVRRCIPMFFDSVRLTR